MRARRPSRRALGAASVVVLGVGGASLALATARSPSGGSVVVPRFVEETATAGLDHRYEGGYEYVVGGGVAAFDCDDDGRPELYVAGGAAPAALFRNVSDTGRAVRFERLASAVTDLDAVMGAYPVDLDGDAAVDLVVLRNGPDAVLRGLGGCEFERAEERFGIADGDTRTVAFSATWEGDALLPTLAFGDYLTADRQGCEDNRLLRPADDGRTYAAPIALTPGYCTLSILFSDWDRSGRRDLRVSNDRNYYRDGSEQLWRLAPGEPPSPYGEADGWRAMQIWGMGIASHDLTGDGRPEVFLTSQADNKLQALVEGADGPTYEDIALERGVTATRPFTGGEVLPSTAWHPEFQDVNDDGLVDLFVSKGNVEAQPDYAARDPNNLLLGRPDGTFVEAADEAGVLDEERSRGAALVDLDVDGMLDLVVVERESAVRVWRNVGTGSADTPAAAGNSVAIRLRQPAPNVDAIGAWVDVRTPDATTTREVVVGGGHAGGQLGWIHVGLGAADDAEVRVQWPDGEVGPWIPVSAGTWSTIERGSPEAIPTPPGEGA